MSIKDNEAIVSDNTDQNVDPKDRISMESTGVVDMDDPNYVEEDDVEDSIAEGYF